MMKLAAVIMNMTILVIALVFFTGMTCGVPNRPRRAGTLNQAQDQGGGKVFISSATGRNEWATLTGLSTHALS